MVATISTPAEGITPALTVGEALAPRMRRLPEVITQEYYVRKVTNKQQ
jgi:hypothetical protein